MGRLHPKESTLFEILVDVDICPCWILTCAVLQYCHQLYLVTPAGFSWTQIKSYFCLTWLFVCQTEPVDPGPVSRRFDDHCCPEVRPHDCAVSDIQAWNKKSIHCRMCHISWSELWCMWIELVIQSHTELLSPISTPRWLPVSVVISTQPSLSLSPEPVMYLSRFHWRQMKPIPQRSTPGNVRWH